MRRGQPVLAAVLPHLVARVRAKPQVGQRFRRADQREAGLLVLRVVAASIGLIDPPLEHPYGAGEVPALLAGGGKLQPVPAGSVENVLLGAAPHGPGRAVRQLEHHLELALGSQGYGL